MELIIQHLRHFGDKLISIRLKLPHLFIQERLLSLIKWVKAIGYNPGMDEYEQRKLAIFNLLNFFQLLTGILIPVVGLATSKPMPAGVWITACLPAMVSALVLYLNKEHRYETALIAYFSLYPFITCLVYLYGLNAGIGLSFILYGILSVFFLKDIGYIIFSLCFSMVSYFILSVVLKHHRYDLQELNNGLYLINHCLALVFIFYGLFLVKKENAVYQYNILSQNRILHQQNIQIQKQADALTDNTSLLKQQAKELAGLNNLKNRLFSIISHDLKAPMYALRNLFREVHQNKMSVTELRKTIPDVLNDLNYTVGLMDNLLQWAKAQMKSDGVHPQQVDIEHSIQEVLQLLHLQAKAKRIQINNDPGTGLYAFADKDMINLVLRNLVSNAIKFTPVEGLISLGVLEHDSFLEVYVKDNGEGITSETLSKINKSDFYTTKGTASESGTGLGLMLCREFLSRNGGQLFIESEPGKGSVFSFTIPKCA